MQALHIFKFRAEHQGVAERFYAPLYLGNASRKQVAVALHGAQLTLELRRLVVACAEVEILKRSCLGRLLRKAYAGKRPRRALFVLVGGGKLIVQPHIFIKAGLHAELVCNLIL